LPTTATICQNNYIKAKIKKAYMNETKISIIIPCYNLGKYISECLDSILAQTFTQWEAIVINDGSTDNSLKIIKRYIKKHSQIRLINQDNQGVVAARNKGILQAKGKFIYPLDGDDKIAPRCLENLYKAIQDKKGDIITTGAYKFGIKNGELVLPIPNRHNMCVQNCLVNSALFRKSDFIKSGGYDHAFDKGLEDYDLWCNMIFNHNLHIYRIPEPLFLYRMKDSSESRNLQINQKFHKNLIEIIYT